ncbi:DUF262 domain-containing protein [Sphingomonas sp. NFR15]|uniref:DUF262 domain-containing protein n=1 Tax=Sphingomonas sp. NFR15 TaxID=1566282 RepID=UPI00088C86D7|nr:DUF262 domain-containing protein [Sphingomonas sp. NFR15]SDA14717.1 Protein of unknown function DUF262 [Sphingomonas sp. NFR15]
MRDTFSADPTVVFLTSVLDDIAQGRIRVPRFQRPLVWSWTQRKEFFESIFAGLPIGALMIWATSNDEVGCYSSLGPHQLPTDKAVGETRYLMDGVQRISTLYGALRATESWVSYDDERDIEMRDFVVYADLDVEDESERFKRRVDIDPSDFKADPYRYLPISILLNSRELLRFQRGLGDGKEKRIDLADEVASAFREYKVPIITLNSASLEVVTKSFERVNSRGADMSELHMLNALTYSPVFDLLKRDQDLRNELLSPLRWHKIDSDIVLRCLKLNLGADIYKTNPDEVSRRLRDDPKTLDLTFAGIANTARFFRKKFGITDPALVPYRVQIVAIATSLQHREFEAFAEELVDWVWLSTYSELFGGTGRQSESAITDLRNFVMVGAFEWSLREPPAVRSIAEVKSDLRAARVKALMLALARRADDTHPMSGTNLLRTFSSDAFMYLKLPKIDRGDQGARFLIEPTSAAEFRARLVQGNISRDEREAHVISDHAMDVIDSDNMKGFTRQRSKDLFLFEQNTIIYPVAMRLGIRNLRILQNGDSEVEQRASDFDRE